MESFNEKEKLSLHIFIEFIVIQREKLVTSNIYLYFSNVFCKILILKLIIQRLLGTFLKP